MAQYNIYRIKKAREGDLVAKLKSVGLCKTYDQTVDGVNCTFYLSANPKPSSIWWADLYKEFIGAATAKTISNQNYFGAFILSGDGFCYVVSLGKTHFYLKDFCHLDFGIDVGTRIIDKQSIDVKSSRLFGGRRRKTLTTYQSDSPIEFDSGEAIVYLKGKTVSDHWGSKVTCGHSVLFGVKGMQPPALPSLIRSIESKLKEDALFVIPTSQEIQDRDEIDRLDEELVQSIRGSKSMVMMDEQSISGVEFVFLKDYKLELRAGGKWWPIDPDISIEGFNELIDQTGMEFTAQTLDTVRIRASTEDGHGFTKDIRHFVDYVDDKRHFLQDGKWSIFNQNYVDFLEESVGSIEFEVRPEFNFDRHGYESFMRSRSGGERVGWYRERYFNEIQMSAFGFRSFDRQIGNYDRYKLEFTDMYKDGTLYFAKIGTPQKLNYVIDQSLAVVKYLIDNQGTIELNSTVLRPDSICILLVLDREADIKRLTDLRSFIFLMKINEWRRQVENARLRPRIVVSHCRA